MPVSAFLSDIAADDAAAADLIRGWFADDIEGRRRLEFYAKPENWFALFGPSRRGWLVMVDGTAVGLADMEINEGCGYIAYYVAPGRRGQGVGTAAVRLIVAQARTLGLTALDGGVDTDNVASIAALRRNGFTFEQVDDEGMFPVKITL